jgi:hypothetical protein
VHPFWDGTGVNSMLVRVRQTTLVWSAALLLWQAYSSTLAQSPENIQSRQISFFIYADSSIADRGD